LIGENKKFNRKTNGGRCKEEGERGNELTSERNHVAECSPALQGPEVLQVGKGTLTHLSRHSDRRDQKKERNHFINLSQIVPKLVIKKNGKGEKEAVGER